MAALKKLLAAESTKDYLWSYLAIGFVGVAGLLTNLEIVYLFSTEMLGLFGITMAVFIIGSQLWVLGVQNSCLHHVSIADQKEQGSIIRAAIVAIIINSLFGLLAIALYWLIANVYLEPQRFDAIFFALLALPSGALLKVLLFSINGMQNFRRFYAVQVTRVVLAAAWIFLVWILHWPSIYICLAFVAAESLCAMGCLFLLRQQLRTNNNQQGNWLSKHYQFGIRSFTSGLSTETHTRVDILVLSAFVTNKELGIYTFITLLIDGLYQFIAVIRNIINPKVAKLYLKQEVEALQKVLTDSKKLAFFGYAALAIIAYFGYPLAIQLARLDPALLEGGYLLGILLLGTTASAWLLPFDQVLSQCGRPGANSWVLACGAVTNLALNLLLVPSLGLAGAALATACSWLLLSFYLYFACTNQIGLNLITGRLAQRQSPTA